LVQIKFHYQNFVTLASRSSEDATVWVNHKGRAVEVDQPLVAPTVWHNYEKAVGDGVTNDGLTPQRFSVKVRVIRF
jgi:hypothetical protein